MDTAMASLRPIASTCLLLETTIRSTSSPPCFPFYKLTRRNKAAKQLIPRQTLSPIVPWYSSADDTNHQLVMSEMYMILEMVLERVEMRESAGERMGNLNMLLLNSINMMTLTATTVSGLAGTSYESQFGLNMSSFALFSIATGILVVMNVIQPSQLAEEQRHATSIFKRIELETKCLIEMGKVTKADAERLMEKILVVDRGYPMVTLSAEMIEKFPPEFVPARWWPDESFQNNVRARNDGWSGALEAQMRDVVEALKAKDMEEYERLGSIALELNKMLAILGPALTGIAALGAAFAGSQSAFGSVAAAAAVVSGALACAVNSIEHGGQIGLVVEMCRNKVGELKQMEEWIESSVTSKRDHGELFEKRVALKLGRNLPELRNLARKSSNWSRYGTTIDEFASKLF